MHDAKHIPRAPDDKADRELRNLRVYSQIERNNYAADMRHVETGAQFRTRRLGRVTLAYTCLTSLSDIQKGWHLSCVLVYHNGLRKDATPQPNKTHRILDRMPIYWMISELTYSRIILNLKALTRLLNERQDPAQGFLWIHSPYFR